MIHENLIDIAEEVKQSIEEENAYIRDNYGKVPMRVICEHLNISTTKLYSRAEKLGLGKIKARKIAIENLNIEDEDDDIQKYELNLHSYPNLRQHYVLCNGGGYSLDEAQKVLLDSMFEFAKKGYVAQGGFSHVIQYFGEEVFIHIVCQAMVKEIKQSELPEAQENSEED